MEKEKKGLNISTKSFITAIVVIFALMVLTYGLTFVIPGGEYARTVDEAGNTIIDTAKGFQNVEGGIPFWKWIISPVLVLGAEGNGSLIAVIAFLLVIGGVFNSLDKCGLMHYMLNRITDRFGKSRYKLMAVVTFFFMALGAFIGSFEECIPLVPIVVALAIRLGWDSLTGLGMSLLAIGCGFASGVCNPFTVGVAQELAGLPMFSGIWLRVVSFMLIYGLLIVFLLHYVKKIERKKEAGSSLRGKVNKAVARDYADARSVQKTQQRSEEMPQQAEESGHGRKNTGLSGELEESMKRGQIKVTTEDGAAEFCRNKSMDRGLSCFVGIVGLGILCVLSSIFISALQDYTMIIVAIMFLVAGISSTLLSGMSGKSLASTFWAGIVSMLPAVLMILMANSIKYTLVEAKILDTLLHSAVLVAETLPKWIVILFIYLIVLVMNFFISSGSAKAFLLIPLIVPAAQIFNISPQLCVMAFAFGDGFSNVFYPTNPVLLIGLGLADVNYVDWVKWSWKFQAVNLVLTSGLLLVGLAVGYC